MNASFKRSVILLLLATAGCSDPGDASGQPDGGDRGPASFATTPGASVMVSGLTAATFTSHGGGLPPFGSQPTACDPSVWTYAWDLTAQTLTWSRCVLPNGSQNASDYAVDTGSHALSTSERTTIEMAFGAVHVSDGTTCGADKPTWDLTVTSPEGTLVYGDDFYVCSHLHSYYVRSSDLDSLLSALSPLAQ
jgi:hypothetical protein